MLNSKFLPALLSIGLSLCATASAADCPVADVSIIAHTGESVGTEVVHNNGEQNPLTQIITDRRGAVLIYVQSHYIPQEALPTRLCST